MTKALLIISLIIFQDNYEWKPIEDSPGHIALWKGGKQVGSLEVKTWEYHSLKGRSWVKESPPIKPPESIAKQRMEDTANYGLEWKEIKSSGEAYSFNGDIIDKETAFGLVEAPDQITDDSTKLRLTLVGSKAKRDQLKALIENSPEWREYSGDVLVQSYPSDHWAVKNKGFIVNGEATIYVQMSAGTVLYKGEDPQKALDAIRIFKRPLAPIRNPWDFSGWSLSLGFNPITWMIGIGASFWKASGQTIMVVTGMICLTLFLIFRKKED